MGTEFSNPRTFITQFTFDFFIIIYYFNVDKTILPTKWLGYFSIKKGTPYNNLIIT